MIHNRLRELKEANSRGLRLIDRYRDNPPGRAESFNIAHEIENRAGEIHFQEFMEKGAESGIEEIFQKLNREDHHHSDRIRAYMDENGIPFCRQKILMSCFRNNTGNLLSRPGCLRAFHPVFYFLPQHFE